jgi:polyphosphate kinase
VPSRNRSPIISAPRRRHTRFAYFNRELSWLAFNRRVLEQAELPDRHPLLERLKFLAIVASNLDEFFEIRVAGLVQQLESDKDTPGLDGLGAMEQLRRIHSVVASLVEHMYVCWTKRLKPAMEKEGIVFLRAEELDPAERRWAQDYFKREVYPVLTPLAIDPSHPFPEIQNKSLNVLCSLNKPETPELERLMALVPVPRSLPRIVRIGVGSGYRFIFISSIIKLCCGDLFPGHEVSSGHVFRVTRNSDLYIDEEEAENLLKKIEDELRNRRRGAPVRLEVEHGVDPFLFKALLDQVGLAHEYVFRVDGPLNLQALFEAYALIDRPDLKEKEHVPPVHPLFEVPDAIFDGLRQGDVLLHHPFESFDPVVRFIRQAAADPDVLAIKQTLYRTSGDSPIVKELIAASRNGKQVTVLMELKARFDEANNIQWAKAMGEAGVHVVYGLMGLKIHAKICLVVRKEEKGPRAYAHLATGNYNPKTARIYTDLSFFTSRPAITSELTRLFHALTGFGRCDAFRHLLVAPYNLHDGMMRMIRSEIANARKGRKARIIAKVNSLVEEETIKLLYRASQAGVKVDLIVRGVCSLVPGIRGLSENIRVRSIVGRFLEHSRIFYFENGGKPLVFAGSADWMQRNFFRRVEVVFPIEDPKLRRRIISEILHTILADDADARLLGPNGAYSSIPRKKGRHAFSSQEHFLQLAQLANAG